MENHHLAVAFKLLQQRDCDVLAALSTKMRRNIRRIIIDIVHTLALLGRIAADRLDAACWYRCSVVCVSVGVSGCRLVTTTSCAKTAEQIEMRFGA